MADSFGKYDVYAVAGSLYCYPDSSVLRNKLNIHNAELLRRVEADLYGARQAEIFYAGFIGNCLEMCIPLQGTSGGRISPRGTPDSWRIFRSKRNSKHCSMN